MNNQTTLGQTDGGKWYDEHGRRVWKRGILVYTRAKLARLYLWLLLGSFTIYSWE